MSKTDQTFGEELLTLGARPESPSFARTQAAAKAADIEIAARAVFEATKASVVDLDGCEWGTLPERQDLEGTLHPMAVKLYYRRDVAAAVEALWRAGRLT